MKTERVSYLVLGQDWLAQRLTVLLVRFKLNESRNANVCVVSRYKQPR